MQAVNITREPGGRLSLVASAFAWMTQPMVGIGERWRAACWRSELPPHTNSSLQSRQRSSEPSESSEGACRPVRLLVADTAAIEAAPKLTRGSLAVSVAFDEVYDTPMLYIALVHCCLDSARCRDAGHADSPPRCSIFNRNLAEL
jgi:hypothetical protein